MQSFHEVRVDDLSPNLMQHAMATRGYVLIRNVIPWLDLMLLMREITQILFREGWLLPGFDPLRRLANMRATCGDPDPTFKRVYQEIFGLEKFHALPHHPGLTGIMKMLVGDHVLIHPKPIGRLIFPNCENLTVHAHQDYRFMHGDPECYTVWIPLHDCPVNVGPLQILEGSHRSGPIHHDSDHLHVPEIPAKTLTTGNWVGGRVNAGDVLVFHSLTVHAASPNISNKFRISLDCRFQDYRRAINPANLAFAGDSGKSWEKIYGTWSCDNLKYYWKKLPLTFQPSKLEIEKLAATAESVDLRSRYARILAQLN